MLQISLTNYICICNCWRSGPYAGAWWDVMISGGANMFGLQALLGLLAPW